MVLNWEDIAGLGFVLWVVFTALFYLVLYMAVLNITDDKLGNSPLKFPVLLALAVPGAFFIAIFNYNPMILFFLMLVSNYFRLRDKTHLGNEKNPGPPVNKPLFYASSFGYLIALYALSAWFQHPVELDGMAKPYWKSWFTEVPH